MEQTASALKWLTLPPIIAIPVFFIANSLRSITAVSPVDASVWGLIVLLFIILSVVYGLFITRNFNAGLFPLQLIAQGMLLCPISLGVGARMIQWVGVTMAVCGAVILTYIYHLHQDRLRPAADAGGGAGEEEALPIRFAITDETGIIVTISDAMLEAAGLLRDEAEGQSIVMLLTPGEPTAQIGGKTWNVVQQPLKDERYYFQLDEPSLPAPEPQPASGGGDPFMDPRTHLQPFNYAMRRLDEELYRTRRYGHPLTIVLVRLAFPSGASGAGQDSQEEEAFAAYCSLVHERSREADTATVSGPRELMAVFPECDAGAAEPAAGKLIELASSLRSRYPLFKDVAPLYVFATFSGQDDLPGGGALLDQLQHALAAKYSINA